MRRGYLRLVFRLRWLRKREDGQDIVEYAFLIALIAAVATAASQSLAVVLTTELSNIATKFNNVL
jgi:Flp pilus assembly pilin Flp